MPLPFIMNSVAPSAAIGSQIAGASRCIGTEISSTVAPSFLRSWAPRHDLGIDVALGNGMPEAFLDDADAQSLDAAVERLRVVRDLGRNLPRIETVRAGQHLEQQARCRAHCGSSVRCDRS